MQTIDRRVLLSASDLMRFQGCAHATALDLAYLRGDPSLKPVEDTASAALVQKLGDAHEDAFLSSLKAGHFVAEVDKSRGFATALEETQAALASGAAYIFQAAFRAGDWGGYADFLERVARPSRLGNFSYEVIDTKLKRTADPKHVLQLVLYSDLLADLQGIEPEYIHVVLGDRTRVSLRLADYADYARHARRRLAQFIAEPSPTRPEPVAQCSLCRWREHCDAQWLAQRDLCLVAGARRDQRRKLEAAGIRTLDALAASGGKVPGLATDTLAKLRTQARLQHARMSGGPPAFVLRDHEPGRGFDRLPEPAKGDLFFDMEGDPHVEDGGLEYLFGVYWVAGGRAQFRPFWAHTREEEREATRAVLDFFASHLAQHPGAHVYHYNHYETTALKRLASQHGVGEEQLDELLRGQAFVDLYRVVQQSLLASEPGYSIKNLEAFYLEKRADAVTTAGDSIVEYERWRVTRDDAILQGIADYNETDCRSTLGLRDWLVSKVRPKHLPWPVLARDAEPETARAAQNRQQRLEADAARDARRLRLGSITGDLAGAPAELLFDLTGFHRREAKPQWWARFDRAQKETEDLHDELDCLGGLVAIDDARPLRRSLARTYRMPPQETKLRAGESCGAIGPALDGIVTVTLEALDMEHGTAVVVFGLKAGAPPETLSLIPSGPIKTEAIEAAILRVLDDALDATGRYPAAQALLTRAAPRIEGLAAGQPLASGTDVAAIVDVIGRLDRSVLAIQGPPGTGKTYVSSVTILALLKAGRRVAVTSNAHKAIDNLMAEVAKRARAERFALDAIKCERGGAPFDLSIAHADSPDDPRLATSALVGGTAHLLCRPEHDQAFDVLFVDEAGQVCLANAVGLAAAARSVVLVGDPMQLPQPVQGTHPGQSGASALGYVLGDAQTVPPARGIFLPVTRRLHPDVAAWVSRIVYEGRLTSDPAAATQRLSLTPSLGLPETGIAFRPVSHRGNGQSCREEVEAIALTWRGLLGQRFRDRTGAERALTEADILIVAPYNAQVNLLRSALPDGARIGTVDKFQGQEAPICLVSMTTSSHEDLPRNLEFLFSINRLNVAISRAMALAVVFASPRLLEIPCGSVEQMRLVNALCAAAASGARSPA